MPASMNADQFVSRMEAYSSPEEREKYQRYFKSGVGQYGEGDTFMGVRMGQVFALAKEFIEMPPDEIDKLLESPFHEVRAGGLSIMDKQARSKKTPESRRKELFDLYLRRIDRINNCSLAKIGQNEREITPWTAVSGNTKLTGPMEGIAQEGSIVRRRLPPVAGAASRSRSDSTVEEPYRLRVPSSASQSRTMSAVAVQPLIPGSHEKGSSLSPSFCLPSYRTRQIRQSPVQYNDMSTGVNKWVR